MVTLNTALAYRRFGWSIIPIHTLIKSRCTCGKDNCSTPGKHPRVRWTEFTTKRPSVAEVTEWFGDAFLGSNIGVVTGSISNLLVVDCDGKEGAISAKYELDLPFPTLVALTGGGGFHMFYKADMPVPSQIGLLDKVDLKAERGFVVLPPSIHISGRKYRWFRKHKLAKVDVSQFVKPASDMTDSPDTEDWERELLKGVGEGMRSSAAARLAGKYAAKGLGLIPLWYLMQAWNRHNRPPLPEDELQTTVKFIYQKHRSEPTSSETLKSKKQLLRIVRQMQ